MEQEQHAHGGMNAKTMSRHYLIFGLNMILSTPIMYLVMFEMIWSGGEFVQNVNFLYMALTMAMPMGMLMLLMMGSMYPNKRLNLLLHGVMALMFVLAVAAVRGQWGVADRQFVRSMIPHHSGAILMCNEAKLRDAELRELCYGSQGIVVSQEREVAQMKQILERL